MKIFIRFKLLFTSEKCRTEALSLECLRGVLSGEFFTPRVLIGLFE